MVYEQRRDKVTCRIYGPVLLKFENKICIVQYYFLGTPLDVQQYYRIGVMSLSTVLDLLICK